MNKVKAVSYSKSGDKLGELVFEDFTPFEAALTIQKDFSRNGLDSEVEGTLKENGEYIIHVSYTGIKVKVFSLLS